MQKERPLETDPLSNLLQSRFGHPEFRPGQRDVIESVLSGRDALAVMPTGGGKSLCYQIPALSRPGITIVISPLIALMKDQVDHLKKIGVGAAAIHSSQSRPEKLEIFSKIHKESRENGSFLLYLSPERVQKPGFADWLRKQQIALIAIDEAHCVSQWGHDFRPDYHKLGLLRELRPDVPILALTATATPVVLKDIAAQLKLNDPTRHVYGFYRSNLYCQVETCSDDGEKTTWVECAIGRTPQGRVLVYCGTRKKAEELSAKLQKKFEGVEYYHAGLSAEARNEVQSSYESGKNRILVATNAFGMGMDYPDIRLVIHFQMPANIESYYQEIGRAGRDGNPSSCLLLYSKKDKALHSFFIRQSQNESDSQGQYIHLRWQALDTILQFIEGGECRHSGILTYFRDSQRIKSCGHCDSCTPDSPRREVKPRVTHLPARTLLRKKSSGSKKSTSETPDAPLSKSEEIRMTVLREWRKSYADSLDLPAFVVFSNRTLTALSRQNPTNLDELSKIHGLGPKKLETFGKILLERLRDADS